ncbi:MAG: hypothetical protein KDD44_01820 [Bdellovibrionales bacterium]|nr:hypothetical protein [Bdellovibrionales bacterium]
MQSKPESPSYPAHADAGASEASSSIAVERIAATLERMRLEAPAILFLELHRPVLPLLHTLALLLEPVATPFFGTERIASLKTLLSSRETIDELINQLEAHPVKNQTSEPIRKAAR